MVGTIVIRNRTDRDAVALGAAGQQRRDRNRQDRNGRRQIRERPERIVAAIVLAFNAD